MNPKFGWIKLAARNLTLLSIPVRLAAKISAADSIRRTAESCSSVVRTHASEQPHPQLKRDDPLRKVMNRECERRKTFRQILLDPGLFPQADRSSFLLHPPLRRWVALLGNSTKRDRFAQSTETVEEAAGPTSPRQKEARSSG